MKPDPKNPVFFVDPATAKPHSWLTQVADDELHLHTEVKYKIKIPSVLNKCRDWVVRYTPGHGEKKIFTCIDCGTDWGSGVIMSSGSGATMFDECNGFWESYNKLHPEQTAQYRIRQFLTWLCCGDRVPMDLTEARWFGNLFR